ncbi:hypothetical protein N7522_010026 [Penicillium canescens]|nr:hypothetical protein N7522_010026 [Penicillium canescens]
MASKHLPLCQDVVAQEELRKFKEEAKKQDKIHSKLAKTIINDIVQSTFDELAKGEHDGPYWDFLARSQNELVESAEKLTVRLTFADVQVDQVQRWFQLTLEKLSAPRDWQGPHEEVQIPQCAAMIDRGMARAETMNEAAVRCRLNIVLFSALDIVMQTPLDGRWPLNIQTETPLVSRPFRFRGKSHQTHGICDYTLWYGDQSISKAINLIIVEAKKKGSCDSGIAQCLGYMGTEGKPTVPQYYRVRGGNR